MSIAPGTNGSYPFKAGEPIFLEGQNVNSINILAMGKVDVYISPVVDLSHGDESVPTARAYKLFSIDQNIFIGANDFFLSKKHTLSYRASKDSIIYSYFVDSINEIEELFGQKNDYSTFILNSISNLIEHSYASLQKLEQINQFLSVMADNLSLFFWILKDKHHFSYDPQNAAIRESRVKLQELKEEKVSLPFSFEIEFLEANHFEYDYFPSKEIDSLKMNFYKQLYNMNTNFKKQFLNESFIIAQYSCTDCSQVLENILYKIKEAFSVAEKYIELLYADPQSSIFEDFYKAGIQIQGSPFEPLDMIEVQQYILNKLRYVVEIFEKDFDHVLAIDVKSMEVKIENLKADLMHKILNKIEPGSSEIRDKIPEELVDSTEKILTYANIPKERYDLFLNSLKAFRGLKDKLSDDEQAKILRKDLTSVFFEIYEAVLKRAIVENNQDKLIDMFLTYAYMDEKLLSPKNLWMLYEIDQNKVSDKQSSIYSMKNWLQLIYHKERNPSVNSFSMDYFDVFRELKKQGAVTDQDKTEYDNNRDKRLSFEIENMFKPNHKLCNRHISTYFPILYDDVIIKDLDKAVVTPQKLNDAMQKVLNIDFSAFHREISYFNMKKGIEKEFIMQSVKPDIILMPAYGPNAIMWQEISSRIRNTPGRFIIPIFTEGNIDEILQRLIGEFRWELCKTMLGLSWNDISMKSLTSEYMDYLQFYKKNRDISEESKEKLKKQIAKHRNISKSIFASDYMTWINYESNGITRLNKVTRDILFKYCPFPRELRQKLANHPSFAASVNLFEKHRAKEVKDLENRFARYTRNGIVLDDEMIETLNFYKK